MKKILVLLIVGLILLGGCVAPKSTVPQAKDLVEIECSYNKYNCADFKTYSEAKATFDFCGGLSNDIHYLDGDDDGIPCESLRW